MEHFESVFGELVMQIDGAKRSIVAWPDWSVTTLVDTCDYWRTILRAISCHRTQLPAYHVLEHLSEQQRKQLWSCASYYRVFSLVNGGREVENDLFAGLR